MYRCATSSAWVRSAGWFMWALWAVSPGCTSTASTSAEVTDAQVDTETTDATYISDAVGGGDVSAQDSKAPGSDAGSSALADGQVADDSSLSDAGSRPEDDLGQNADAGSEDSTHDDVGAAYDPQKPPGPFPTLSEEVSSPCPKALADKYYFQFLDNLCDEKVQPSHVDADFQCPVTDWTAAVPLKGGGTAVYVPYDQPLAKDTTALSGLLPSGMEMTVMQVKRVGGVPHLRVLGTPNHDKPLQPWSTTKWIAAANAAGTLRKLSGGKVGLTASVKGFQVGDLVTSMHTYDNSPYNSNGLGRWFHDIGGRQRANALIHELWLKRPASESFGGNYGSAAPPLGYSFTAPDGGKLSVTPDGSSGPSNHLSPYTLALALQRVVHHREQPKTAMPDLTWDDAKVLLYGAPNSQKYGAFGGLSADTAIYAQAAVDIVWIAKRSQGKWRIHSKLGLGSKGQFIWVGYACLPWLDSAGQPIPGWGREVVISAHLAQGGKSWSERDRLFAKGVRRVMLRVLDGRL